MWNQGSPNVGSQSQSLAPLIQVIAEYVSEWGKVTMVPVMTPVVTTIKKKRRNRREKKAKERRHGEGRILEKNDSTASDFISITRVKVERGVEHQNLALLDKIMLIMQTAYHLCLMTL